MKIFYCKCDEWGENSQFNAINWTPQCDASHIEQVRHFKKNIYKIYINRKSLCKLIRDVTIRTWKQINDPDTSNFIQHCSFIAKFGYFLESKHRGFLWLKPSLTLSFL